MIYDARLRWTMPATMDERIVIVDIDEKSLAEVGHWPWGRNRLAELANELFERQQAALVGFDIVFAEPDESSGLKQLQLLAKADLKDQPGFAERISQLKGSLDYDALFAESLRGRPAVLGYYFTNDRGGRTSGVLPHPVMDKESLRGRSVEVTRWNGFGASIDQLAAAAPLGGFFNPMVDSDGVVRSVPLRCRVRRPLLRVAVAGHVPGGHRHALSRARLSDRTSGFAQLPEPRQHSAAAWAENVCDSGRRRRHDAGSFPRSRWAGWPFFQVRVGFRRDRQGAGAGGIEGQDRPGGHHGAGAAGSSGHAGRNCLCGRGNSCQPHLRVAGQPAAGEA